MGADSDDDQGKRVVPTEEEMQARDKEEKLLQKKREEKEKEKEGGAGEEKGEGVSVGEKAAEPGVPVPLTEPVSFFLGLSETSHLFA